jgi:hypothetical protein
MTRATFGNFVYRSYQVLLTDVVIIPRMKSIKIKKQIDEKRTITPRWVIRFTSQFQGR